MFWIVASPDGLVSDRSINDENVFRLIEIQCPKSKRYANVNELLEDDSFYIEKIEPNIEKGSSQ